MSELGATALVVVGFLALAGLGVPVAFALGLSAFAYCLAAGVPTLLVAQKVAAQLTDTTLLAIPFFILCGELMTAGEMGRRLVDAVGVLVGRVRGGLAVVNVGASMFFGGISGSSVADTSSIGSLLIPLMEKKGYGRDYAVAVTVTGSTQGILIPPSHNAILYALAAGGAVSIQALFLAGYVPGILVGVAVAALAAGIARRRGYPREPAVDVRTALRILLTAIPALATPVLIILPIALGKVPAAQAAILAVVWSAFVSTVVYRSLPLRRYPEVLKRTTATSAMVLVLIACAAAFGEVLTLLHVPARLAGILATVTDSRVALLLLLNGALLLLGMVMDMAPLILILTPILLPVVTRFGVDPTHFGIVLLLNLAIGLCTPPVGATLFVGAALGKIPIERAVKAMLPFYAAMVAVLLLVTFVPELALALPRWVAGRGSAP